MSDFTRITLEELNHLIEEGVLKMNKELLKIWNEISIKPEKWIGYSYIKEGEEFWVVGKFRDKVIWYNDTEEGFNISNYRIEREIGEFGFEQDELEDVIYKLKNVLQ
ncbi:hypothetical protein [Aureivirga sp. CE67]|uniref:hypothetical protein n=1 Tax=Aureivirga sp. CE67 TaxID=1788983 RepID=UPI0018CACC0C|nr:hypothetical protein [Aureivirga sp. CE67]